MLTQIGNYRVIEEIGRGGFGRVYKCLDASMKRIVAVKLLLPEAAGSEHSSRFQLEAATTAKLNHPNLVVVYKFGEHEGMQFLAMEYLEGEDLQKRIRSATTFPLFEKVGIMQQVAAGLHSAHESGVVHRDVKPSNIMLLRNGSVKIMDFGIARVTRNDASRLTKTGLIIGTLNYISPEQFQTGDVDALCDIWSYGVMYYELLTGKYPFQGESTANLMWAISNTEPAPLRPLAPDCPPALEEIVLRALSKDREQRYQSLEDLRLDVEPILVDLRRQQARVLLPSAQRLIMDGNDTEALTVLKSILELDPADSESRRLRENILKQSHRRAITTKVESLRGEAAAHLRNREFPAAVQKLEGALRLNPSHPSLSPELAHANAALERANRASQLLDSAFAAFNRNDLALANLEATEACNLDPAFPHGAEFLAHIRKAVADSDRRHASAANVERARSMLSSRAVPEAMTLLQEIERAHPDAPGLDEAKQMASRISQETARYQRCQAQLSVAYQSLASGNPDLALQQLKELEPEFGAEPAFHSLHSEILSTIAMRRRSLEVFRALTRGREFFYRGKIEEAVQSLESSLRDLGSDPGLESLLQQCRETILMRRKEESILEFLRQAEDRRGRGNLAAAMHILTEALLLHPNEPRLLGLQHSIASGLLALAQRYAYQDAAKRVRDLQRQNRFADAAAEARRYLLQWPNDPLAPELLRNALSRVPQ